MKLFSFSQFVNESYNWSGPLISSEVRKDFKDFDFEVEIPGLALEVETAWISLMEKYWWNRESRYFRYDHFALNVKLYRAWPDKDKAGKILGREVDDDELYDLWYRFIDEQREMWQEELSERFNWIKETGFGGKSGGWLILAPNIDFDDFEAYFEEECESYMAQKRSVENLEEILQMAKNPGRQRLTELGLAQAPDELIELETAATQIKDYCRQSLAEVRQIKADLAEIENDFANFEKAAEGYFEEYLEGLVN